VTGILIIKPIDERGAIDDELYREIFVHWEHEDTPLNLGKFITETVNELREKVKNREGYETMLPAFDLTLELRGKK